VAGAEAYLHAKFHLDPYIRLATINRQDRQTDRQRSDSIVRTALQTVAQKQCMEPFRPRAAREVRAPPYWAW